ALNVTRIGSGSGRVTAKRNDTNGQIVNCPGDCTETLPQGVSVTLTAVPDTGSQFVRWTGGACSGTSTTCTVTMSAARNLTAEFRPVTRLVVSVLLRPGNYIMCERLDTGAVFANCTGDCEVTLPAGTEVSLTHVGITNDINWADYSGCLGADMNCTFSV